MRGCKQLRIERRVERGGAYFDAYVVVAGLIVNFDYFRIKLIF